MEELYGNLVSVSYQPELYYSYRSNFVENYRNLIAMISTPELLRSVKSNSRVCIGLLIVMSNLSDKIKDINNIIFDIYNILIQSCYSKEIHHSDFLAVEHFLSESFHNIFISFPKAYGNLAKFYYSVDTQFESSKFTVAKAILAFLSYKLDLPNLASSFINCIYIKNNSEKYFANYNYIMLSYFKGVFQLSKRRFNDAAANFLIAIKTESSDKYLYTYHQVESYKRLSILAGIIDPDLASLVRKALVSNIIFEVSGMSIYNELKNLTQEKKISVFSNFKFKFSGELSRDKLLVSFIANCRAYSMNF